MAQTMAMGKRGKSVKLDSSREAKNLRVEGRDAAMENEEWMVRDTQAYDELSKLYHHAVDLQDALVALYAEWDAVGPKLRKWEDAQLGISANILFPLEWAMDDGEDRVRVSRIHQALVREEKREVWELGWHGCLKKSE